MQEKIIILVILSASYFRIYRKSASTVLLEVGS